MKNGIFVILLFCASSLWAQDTLQTEVEITEGSQILGTWWVDSAYFVTNGVQGEGSTPILPTSWTFSEDGSMIIENASQMFTGYEWVDNHLQVEMLGMILDYTILELTDHAMRLSNVIYETDAGSMKAISILRRR